jgi:hypothetical protein
MVKKIKFTIGKDGEVKLDVEGIQGSGCKEFTQDFEEELGVVENTELKDSYYQEDNVDDQLDH